ncbi:MAG: glutamate synthase central domain-containing protein, partial [Wenzhouxiangellaceae bacterium]
SCGFGLIARLDGRAEHATVADAIQALERLTHRGAVAPDGKTGDGCGLLLTFPRRFLVEKARQAGIVPADRFAVGVVFLDRDAGQAGRQRERLERQIERVGLGIAGWREVPVQSSALGERARTTLPRIEHVYVNAQGEHADDATAFRRLLYLARRRVEAEFGEDEQFYVASLSADTVSWKGMVMPGHLAELYPDLQDPTLESAAVLFHQRFSTNTLPRWELAQPFRMLAHNGEINTIRGNRNWARARRALLAPPDLPELAEIDPPVAMHGSDSSSLDNMLELLVIGGLPLPQALRILIPPAWQTADNLDADLKAFHEFYAFHQEAWDGPAGLVMTDGRWVVCGLDRNGLRPARWTLTADRRLIVASETGVVDVPTDQVVARGRLGPGELLAADLETGELHDSDAIDEKLKQLHPWQDWLKNGVHYLDSELVDLHMAAEPFDADTLASYQKMFNLSREERREVIRVLAETESEAIGSMGDDTPMPVLSTRIRSLYDCCRQQFAQVTNPAIDPLRERIVMSLETGLGRKGNLFAPSAELAER